VPFWAVCGAACTREDAAETPGQPPREGELPALFGATDWINSPELTPASVRGRVVLIDFWTYSCINWRRTLPYLRAWADKYRGQPSPSSTRGGRFGDHKFGESDYERSERVIQGLLSEAGVTEMKRDLVRSTLARWKFPPHGTPCSPLKLTWATSARRGSRVFAGPARLTLNQWALPRDWTVARWSATSAAFEIQFFDSGVQVFSFTFG
jgi:thiol-disulfide isomerase/thioredoxin